MTTTPAVPDALRDPHRIAAARRLMLEVPAPAAFDRLSRLAAKLVGAGHAKVTLFTDQDTVIGGFGLPPGVIGGPALLTGALSAIVVRQGTPLSVPDAQHDPHVADLPAVTSGQVKAYLGSPLVAASGHVVGVLAVYDPELRSWGDDEAELLKQLGNSVVAELELSAARSAIGTSAARLDVALEASSIGIWEHDYRTGTVYWDERCGALFGLDGGIQFDDIDELLHTYVHPDDHESLTQGIAGQTEDGQYTVEFRALRVDGTSRWMVARGRRIADSRGTPVRILGTMLDVTEARRQAEQRLSAMQRAAAIAEVAAELANATRMRQLADVALRGAQVLDATSSAIAVFEQEGGPLRMHMSRGLVAKVGDVAPEVELPEEGVEVPLDDAGPAQYTARHGRRVLLADRHEGVERFPQTREAYEILGIGASASLPLRVEGRLLGAFVVVWPREHQFTPDDLEVLEALAAQIALSVSRLQSATERTAAVAAMGAANERLQILAEAGRVLSGTVEIDQQIEQLAGLVVPQLGDWCWIVVTDESGRLYELGSAHRDPARGSELEDYVRSMVTVMTEHAAARVVTRTGEPLILPEIPREWLDRSLPDPATQEALIRLGAQSAAVVPLLARGEVMGALGLFNTAERGPHTAAEVETAAEIGRRAGLALHHARLFGQQRDLADALQRSMLTDPPRPEDCEIVVRYVPAAAGAEIGGDWYDAFLQAGGQTVLAIGDVVGHDTRAAAAMGQVRSLLRGISYSSGGSPAEVLTELDRAVEGLALGTMATALVARLEHDGDQRIIRWASAGHPPPILLTPAGEVRLLGADKADLLLGVAPESPREDHLAELPAGATVLLYTDGLVERRDRDIDTGTDELCAVLAGCADLPLAELCDRVLERLFLPDAEDDVALLGVRLR